MLTSSRAREKSRPRASGFARDAPRAPRLSADRCLSRACVLPRPCVRSSLTGALFLFVVGGLINVHYPYIHIPGDTGVLSQQVRVRRAGGGGSRGASDADCARRARRAAAAPLILRLAGPARAQTVYAGLLYLACAAYSLYYWLAGARRQGYMAVPARSH